MKGKFPNQLREVLLREGLTPAALAKAAGTAPQNVHRFLNGERKLTREWAEKLAAHIPNVFPPDLMFTESQLGNRTSDEALGTFPSATRKRNEPLTSAEVSAEAERGIQDILERHGSGHIHVGFEVFYRELYAQLRMLRIHPALANDVIDDFLEVLRAVSTERVPSPKEDAIRIGAGSEAHQRGVRGGRVKDR